VKISHHSDTHGLPRQAVHDEADVIVLSGDLCPNRTRGHVDIEIAYQENWLARTGEQWRVWAKGKPLVLIPGNHDFFIDIARMLRRAGVAAHDVYLASATIYGVTFLGLPDIPWMGGDWNHERGEQEIEARFATVLDERPDVVVNHCPPHGVLDEPYDFGDYHIGSTAFARLLGSHGHEPKAYLCGHCHERGGRVERVRSTIVSNAATRRALIEI